MYHQVVVTLPKIASHLSASTKRGLHNKVEIILFNKSASWKIERQAQLQKNWNRRGLRTTRTFVKPVIGSTSWHRDVSVCNFNRSFELDGKTGLGVGNFLFRANACFLGVPYRTLKTVRDNGVEGARSSNFFARIRNKLFGAGPAAAKPGIPPEKLNELLKGLNPFQANLAKIGFLEGYIAAGPIPVNQQSRTYRWLLTLKQFFIIAALGALLFPLSVLVLFSTKIIREVIKNWDASSNNTEVRTKGSGVTFRDVKGVDEAKSELQDVVQFLRNPQKFAHLGAKLPKGILLVGPPGTGKTLLARAVAGEAGVPFIHVAASQVNGMFVGQGAKRVHDLFEAAKAMAPCVIFIDEIDSIGAKRTDSTLHPYANQTINQLLSEMDGFFKNNGVIVLAATNRVQALDPALLRPGRFDVNVQVPAPELRGRKAILEHYLGKVRRGNDIDIDSLARQTIGFTGAQLENMVNQAALKAGVEGAKVVARRHLEFARDKIVLGVEKKSVIPDKQTSWITACHESGHALVALYTEHANPVHKVTIGHRDSTLGHTSYLPNEEQYYQTRAQLMALLDTMMGGRAAEELIFGAEKVTSGASSDLEKATAVATDMVKRWGMSEKFGIRTAGRELGPGLTELIDSEINKILHESYERAKNILREHRTEVKALAEALMKYGTLDADDIKAVLAQAVPKEKNLAV